MPFYEFYVVNMTRSIHAYITNIIELESNMMPDELMWTIYALAGMTFVLSTLGYIAMICADKSLTQGFLYIKLF